MLIGRATLASLLILAASPIAIGQGQAPAFPTTIALPEGFAPEGIATGRGTSFYAGDLNGGRLLKGDYRTGIVETLALSPGTAAQAVGLKIDLRSNFLFVAAATFGARVYDASTGALIESYPFIPTTVYPVLINDVALTPDAAFFTDSCSTTIYKLPLGPAGRLPDPSEIQILPLTGDFQFTFVPLPGFPCGIPNMNGIVATSNGKWLIVNNTATGELFRVDSDRGESVRIQLANSPFSTPFTDGLLLHGTMLYSVENFPNQIAVINLSKDLLTGTIEGYIRSPSFDVPTTAAFFGSFVYAINGRFRLDGSSPPESDDDVVLVPK